MLRATHTVLKTGGRNCFYVIYSKENMTDSERRRLERREGNEHVESPLPYERLMAEAGFVDVEVADCTPEYIDTIKAWKREWEGDADAFIDLLGEEEFSQKIRNRILDISNAEDGLTRRTRVFGVKPRAED